VKSKRNSNPAEHSLNYRLHILDNNFTGNHMICQLDADSQVWLNEIRRRMPDPWPLDARVLRLAERAATPSPDPESALLARITEAEIPGPACMIPIRIYKPHHRIGGTLVFFHGGGFVLGNLDTHDAMCRILAAQSACTVISIAYRLAPEHPFPAALDDAWAAILWAAEYDPGKLAVAGDSAGGNLAANLALMARDRGGPRLALQMLFYPLTHRLTATPSETELAEGYLLTADLMRWFRCQHGAQSDAARFPYNGPFDAADHRHLPPALIINAECDPLRDQGAEYAAKLRAAAVPVEHICYPGTLHGFMQYPHRIGKARLALTRAADTLRMMDR
jgi:acetyl esterase